MGEGKRKGEAGGTNLDGRGEPSRPAAQESPPSPASRLGESGVIQPDTSSSNCKCGKIFSCFLTSRMLHISNAEPPCWERQIWGWIH